ncbi:Dual specificity protein phosphatase 6 [Nowakowskiella sp. JEL0407]|nr:Dual specificity protein phosphatase 6 [Nowakowskiella sp. JEL0407]
MRELPGNNALTDPQSGMSRSSSAASLHSLLSSANLNKSDYFAKGIPHSDSQQFKEVNSEFAIKLSGDVNMGAKKNTNLEKKRISQIQELEQTLRFRIQNSKNGITGQEFLTLMEDFGGVVLPFQLLVIDVRDSNVEVPFIRSSVNIHLPNILQKRIRKGMVTKVPLESFIADDESRRRFNEWTIAVQKDAMVKPECSDWVVVYDDEVTDSSSDSIAKCYTQCLADEFSNSKINTEDDALNTKPGEGFRKRRNTIVTYIEGGFSAFEKLSGSQKYIRIPPRVTGMSRSSSGVIRTESLMSISNSASQSNLARIATRTKSRENISDLSRFSMSNLKGALGSSDDCSETKKGSVSTSETHKSPPVPRGRKKSNFSINTALPGNVGTSENRPNPGDTKEADLLKHTESSPTQTPVDASETTEAISEILKYLYLGSDTIPCAADYDEHLSRYGITHVLNMAREVRNERLERDSRFVYKWLMLDDNADQEIDSAIKDAINFISNAKKSSPSAKVFVHCRAGKSRSATAVIAYLIDQCGMSLHSSLVSAANKVCYWSITALGQKTIQLIHSDHKVDCDSWARDITYGEDPKKLMEWGAKNLWATSSNTTTCTIVVDTGIGFMKKSVDTGTGGIISGNHIIRDLEILGAIGC